MQFQILVQGGVSHIPLATSDQSRSPILDNLDPIDLAVTSQAPDFAPRAEGRGHFTEGLLQRLHAQ